ncbi:hypothetical protein Hanom_Chr05g00438571 [Helianthus anomalus]
MVKPELDLWTGTDTIFRVVNRFCILCLIGSQVGSGNGRVGSGFLFCSPLSKPLGLKILKWKSNKDTHELTLLVSNGEVQNISLKSAS